MFLWCLRMLQGCVRDVLLMCWWYVRDVLLMCWWYVRDVLLMCWWCVKDAIVMFQMICLWVVNDFWKNIEIISSCGSYFFVRVTRHSTRIWWHTPAATYGHIRPPAVAYSFLYDGGSSKMCLFICSPLAGRFCHTGDGMRMGGTNRGQYLYHHPIE